MGGSLYYIAVAESAVAFKSAKDIIAENEEQLPSDDIRRGIS